MRAVQVSRQVSRFLTAALLLTAVSSAHAGDDGAWTVSKSSGEVWLTNSSAQPASLRQEEMLKPGDTIRTGRTGRVLLKRGNEWHSPDRMVLNAQQILMVEPVTSGSRVAHLIAELTK